MDSNTTITARVEKLRGYMRSQGLSAFIIPSCDPHMSEYTPARWQSRQWISGFNGSAGTAVVTLKSAALWTDSRYFIAATQQLAGTPFTLMKDGLPDTPTIGKWLTTNLERGNVVGADGSVTTLQRRDSLEKQLEPAGITLRLGDDPFDDIWSGRPDLPHDKITAHPLEYAGESRRSKARRLLEEAKKRGCDALLLSALDDIAWTTNLRGSDVECNPVFVAYLIISEGEETLYVNREKVDDALARELKADGIALKPYENVCEGVKNLSDRCTLLPSGINCNILRAFECDKYVMAPSVAETLKAVKNKIEIKGFHNAMLRDGVAMVSFLSALNSEVEKGITEMGVDRLLTSLRASQPLYRGLSFPTIAAYGAHGAIVHYEADEASDVKLEPHGFILIDSGAQYNDGTTDITRTVPLGPLTDEEREVYTLVLKGHIALSKCVFPDGASGTQIDCTARYAMWRHLMNYGHGTGHGVGSYLNVHEGPHQIRMNYMPAPLHAGMTVTDEPGIYIEGKFGVRTENTLLTVPAGKSTFGKFLKFEPLTLCPISTAPIIWKMMSEEEITWINDYHFVVRSKLLPEITAPRVKQWLVKATEPVG